MRDIAQIPLNALVPAHYVAAFHLRQPGHARPDAEAAQLPRVVPLHLVGQRGPGADQAHFAAQHIDELRQFVGGEPAQDPAGPGDPGLIRQYLAGWRGHRHRAQFEQDERLAAAAGTHLAEQDGAPVGFRSGERGWESQFRRG